MHVREITPKEYLPYLGNGYAVMHSYMEEHPEVIEAFGRALVRGLEFGMIRANEERVLEHTAAGNPQEGEDPAFAPALLEAIKGRLTPADPDEGWGCEPPEHWELWHGEQIASGARTRKNTLSRSDRPRSPLTPVG
jgi:NitT/TauT family transport system substrate-binding protein